MIVESEYICEVCGARFDNEDDAMKCESNHYAPIGVEIRDGKYPTKYPYPYELNVSFSDGNVIRYRKAKC